MNGSASSPSRRPFSVFRRGHTFTVIAAALCLGPTQIHAAEPLRDDQTQSARSLWVASVTTDLSAGYKDNILLSHADREASAFVRGGVDCFAWRPSAGRMDYLGYLAAEGTRFLSSSSVDKEIASMLRFESRYTLSDAWLFTLAVQGAYHDQVLDVSDIASRSEIGEFKVFSRAVNPLVRWSVSRTVWIEAEGTLHGESYQGGTNDATVTEAGVRVGWPLADWAEFQVQGTERERKFERRPWLAANGVPEPDSRLVTNEREVSARLQFRWGSKPAWKTVTRVGESRYEDNGVGFLNYRERFVRQDIEWKHGRWAIALDARAKRQDFPQQFLGRGTVRPHRVSDEYFANLSVEREVSKRWTLFVAYEWERHRSNDILVAYKVNEGLLGARWSWDK